MKVRVGLIGCGRMAQRFHLKSLSGMKDSSLIALCDVREDVLRKLASIYHVDRVYEDYRELLRDREVDAVVVTTPPEAHFKILRDAVDEGKHVFVEKPLATTLEECKRLAESFEESRAKLMVGFMRRFDKALVWSKGRTQAGALGETLVIASSFGLVSTYSDYVKKTDSGIIGVRERPQDAKLDLHSLITNHLIHHADLMRWFGGDVERLLAANIVRGRDFGLNAVLKFRRGCVGNMQFKSLKTEWRETLEIDGTRGSISVKLPFPYLDTPSEAVFVSAGSDELESPLLVTNRMYEKELSYFLGCVSSGSKPEPSGFDALEAQRILHSIERSLKKEAWVDVV